MFGILLAGVGDHLGTGLRKAVGKIETLFLVRAFPVFQSPSDSEASFLCVFVTLLIEMACQSHHRACDLSRPVHPAGLPAVCGGADFYFPRGGGMDPAGVSLLCCDHLDDSGLWRLCGR